MTDGRQERGMQLTTLLRENAGLRVDHEPIGACNVHGFGAFDAIEN